MRQLARNLLSRPRLQRALCAWMRFAHPDQSSEFRRRCAQGPVIGLIVVHASGERSVLDADPMGRNVAALLAALGGTR